MSVHGGAAYMQGTPGGNAYGLGGGGLYGQPSCASNYQTPYGGCADHYGLTPHNGGSYNQGYTGFHGAEQRDATAYGGQPYTGVPMRPSMQPQGPGYVPPFPGGPCGATPCGLDGAHGAPYGPYGYGAQHSEARGSVAGPGIRGGAPHPQDGPSSFYAQPAGYGFARGLAQDSPASFYAQPAGYGDPSLGTRPGTGRRVYRGRKRGLCC